MKREYWKYAGVASVFLLLGTFLTPIIFHTISVQKEIHPLIAQGKRDMSPGKSQAVHMEDAFQEVFDKVSPSVVSIATERTVKFKSPMGNDPFFDHFFGGNGGGRPQEFKQKQTGLGSGIILNEEGYVLTNEHVVRDMEKLTVKLKNKKTYEAKLIGADKVMDIALLKIKPGNDLVPVQIGDSSKVKVGHWAIAIGAPLGFEQSFT
ncbi:MAG TPA: trypsin-like peptidase domain-containing protein, partial [Leptospiraceae bacterium]|nr:trypsin-like peptidase domain-containing protein [Leptospiraceae bacterium]